MSEPNDPWGNAPSANGAAPPPAAPAAPAGREWQLIEKLLLEAQVEQRRVRRWGLFFKGLTFLYLFALLGFFAFSSAESSTPSKTTEHVAMVEVKGVIADGADADAKNLTEGLRDAFEAKHAKAVIVHVNSPGGSPVQAGIVYDEIRRLRAAHPDKKVYAVISDMGASGGYYIASAADSIYVDKASIVGSIGVIMNGFGAEELIHKLGIEDRTMTSGENKAILSPFAPVTEEQKKHVQGLLDTIHAQFIAAVKDGRGKRLKDDPAIFSGLFWTGEQAVRLGLADGLGTPESVARDIVGTEDIVDYSYQRSPFEKLAERFGTQVGTSIAERLGAGAWQVR